MNALRIRVCIESHMINWVKYCRTRKPGLIDSLGLLPNLTRQELSSGVL